MNEESVEDQTQKRSLPVRNAPPSGLVVSDQENRSDVDVNNPGRKGPSGRSISPRMREEDADLLESMHYASSQVSHYTPDGTPLLRPGDRSLPMQDVPLISMPIASTSELLMKKEDDNDKYINSSRRLSFRDTEKDNSIQEGGIRMGVMFSSNYSVPLQQLKEEHPSFGNDHSVEKVPSLPELSLVRRTSSDSGQPKHSQTKLSDHHHNRVQSMPMHMHMQQDGAIRRLLSGEIRTVDGVGLDEATLNQQHAIPGTDVRTEEPDDETVRTEDGDIVEPTEPDVPELSPKTKNEQEGLAERRRVSEAILFAQSVQEVISINKDDLCIIDDDEIDDDDDDDEDDDDDGEGNDKEDDAESKEIVALNTSIHENMMSPEYLIGMTPVTPKKTKSFQMDPETPMTAPAATAHQHRKTRLTWPFKKPSDIEFSIMNHLSDGPGDRTNFVYKGICANPPEITKRGIQRGNYAQLHRKAWLEVTDKYHRYGKNLRLYYRYWERLGFPTNQFFDWLDSKGEAAGQPLPVLDECPRSILDSDTVLYITNPDITERYALTFLNGEDGRGLVLDADGDPVQTGPDGWIFILRDNVTYGSPKITSVTGHSKQRFHHSSFFGGKAVASAGIFITDCHGYLTRLYPHSGHYRPGEAHMQRMLFYLHRNGVDLRTFEVDTQQLSHVSREKEESKKKASIKGKTEKNTTTTTTTKNNNNNNNNGADGEPGKEKSDAGKEKKMKKVDTLHLEKAVDVACFLAHKADFIGKGVFDKIHQIRKADVTSVSEALNLVDGDQQHHSRNVS